MVRLRFADVVRKLAYLSHGHVANKVENGMLLVY